MSDCNQPHVKNNCIFGYKVPNRHYAVIDAAASTICLYAPWGNILHPEEYLARYYDRNYAAELDPVLA